jgi:hypothetical protein
VLKHYETNSGHNTHQGAFQWYQEFGMGHHGLGDLDGQTKQNKQVPSQIS